MSCINQEKIYNNVLFGGWGVGIHRYFPSITYTPTRECVHIDLLYHIQPSFPHRCVCVYSRSTQWDVWSIACSVTPPWTLSEHHSQHVKAVLKVCFRKHVGKIRENYTTCVCFTVTLHTAEWLVQNYWHPLKIEEYFVFKNMLEIFPTSFFKSFSPWERITALTHFLSCGDAQCRFVNVIIIFMSHHRV